MSEWVFVRYPLIAVGCRGYYAIGVYLSPIATACGEYNYPAPPAQVCRLGLPFKQSSFIPHSQRFTLPFSSGSIVSQLTTLPICYTPHWVSPPDKSVGDRVICTSLRNTFSYCRATGRIPNCPRAALAYAAALPGAQNSLNELVQNQFIDQNRKNNTDIPQDFLVNHISGSFVEMVLWWIKGRMKQTPEELDRYFRAVIEPIL